MKNICRTVLLLLFSMISGLALADGCCRNECLPHDSCNGEITSRSYLEVRPLFKSSSAEMISACRSDRLHLKEDGFHSTAEAVVFGSNSTNSRELARYFMPFGKTELIVEEFSASTIVLPTSSRPLDILANHFNIHTRNGDFKSKISLRPEQSVAGVGFLVQKAFAMNEEKGRGFFVSLSMPIQRVKNNLKLQEDIITDGGGVFRATPPDRSGQRLDNKVEVNMTDALNQDAWDFGKIKSDAMIKSGVADLEVKVGYEWIQQEPFHLDSYVGIVIPTGNKSTGRYLFEPIVGNGKHWGLMLGNSLGIQIWSDEAKNRSFRMEYASNSQYLFKNTQCRSVDLVNKPWSRYIELYRNEDEAITAESLVASDVGEESLATPGINILTLPVKVRPGFSYNMTTAAVFRADGLNIEGGYNLFCRQSECIKLACPWQQGPAIKDISGIGHTNPVRNMTGNARLESIELNSTPGTGTRISLGDYKYNMIKEQDLDLNSAATPTVITHTIYGAIGYRWDDYDYPMFLNAGGSYEFNKGNNAGVERWVLWGKIGLSF